MAKIGVNLRVTGYCSQGNRKYMEDMFLVACQKTVDFTDIEYAFCGIFDGHGGAEAAMYAKEHLLDAIVSQRSFWSDNDEDILRAIHDGFLATHYTMWKDIDKWPKTQQGLPSTAGTTATVAFIIRGKIYIGHVGDTGIALGYHQPGQLEWTAKQLTRDHKPENKQEITRIERAGGKVVAKSGVPRIVWNRPQIGHEGPVRRSTRIDEIPFLAVARSLGDFWSYNSQLDEFVVSPEPDVNVFKVDITRHKCLIFGTDGLWNIVTPAEAVSIVQRTEAHNDKIVEEKAWLNPSKCLVDTAIERWGLQNLRADNTSVVVLLLDPPGPPNSNILINSGSSLIYATEHSRRPWMSAEHSLLDETEEVPQSGGLAIFRHYPQTSNIPDDGPTCSSILHGHSCGPSENDLELVGVSKPVDDDLVSSDDSDDYNNSINDLDISDTCVPSSSQPASSQLSQPHLNISTCPSQSSQGSRVQGQTREAETDAPRDEVNQRSATVLSRSSDVFNPKSPEYRRFRKRSNEERYSHCDEENVKSDEENINWIDDTWSREPKKTTQPKDETKRTLRSNTSAAKCVKTLRSRNVDLMSPCVKKSRPNDVKAVKRKLACPKTSNLKYGTKKIQQQWSSRQPRSSSKTRRGQSSANLEK